MNDDLSGAAAIAILKDAFVENGFVCGNCGEFYDGTKYGQPPRAGCRADSKGLHKLSALVRVDPVTFVPPTITLLQEANLGPVAEPDAKIGESCAGGPGLDEVRATLFPPGDEPDCEDDDDERPSALWPAVCGEYRDPFAFCILRVGHVGDHKWSEEAP